MSSLVDERYKRFFVVILSLLTASFIINLFIKYNFSFSYISMSAYNIRQNIDRDTGEIAVYLIVKRLEQLAVILIFMHWIRPIHIYNFIVCLLGAFLGVMISVQTYYEGIVGVILLLLYMLPHYPVYVFFLWLLAEYRDKIRSREAGFSIILILSFTLLIGIASEILVSRFFLNEFYQYMVKLG